MVTPKGSISINEQAATLLEFHVPLANCFVHRWFCVVRRPKPLLHSQNWLSFGKFQTQNAFLFPVYATFRHDCPLAVKPASTPRRLGHKINLADSLPIDTSMLPFGMSIPATVPQRSEIPEGLMNYPVHKIYKVWWIYMLYTCWSG
jgi:hypothetical protein